MDFEVNCQPDKSFAGNKKEEFEKNTRATYLQSIIYMASIHLAYRPVPNHDRITPSSLAELQCTRAVLETVLAQAPIDTEAEIVTLILDVVTDKSHIHLVKAKAEAEAGEEAMEEEAMEEEAREEEAGEEEAMEEEAGEHGAACSKKPKKPPTTLQKVANLTWRAQLPDSYPTAHVLLPTS